MLVVSWQLLVVSKGRLFIAAVFGDWRLATGDCSRSRSTMDSIRVSEALDSGSIPDEITKRYDH